MKIASGSTVKMHQGTALYQYLAAFTGYLTIITSGMHYGWPSPSLPKLLDPQSQIQITDDEGSWIAVMPLLGAVIGSLMVGVTVDILGRKNTILVSTFPYFTAWIMVAYANSGTVINIARLLAGIADGWIFTALPMYIGEIADPSIRGLLGSAIMTTWISGVLFITLLGSYLTITVTALISSLLPVLALLAFVWMPESPYQYIMRGKMDEARKSLQKFKGTQDVDADLNRLSNALKEQMENSGKFLDVFTTRSNRRAMMVIVILRTAQQMSGTTAITFYSQDIFKEAGDDISPEVASSIYFAIQLAVTCVCSGVVDKVGRRPLLMISAAGSTLALLIEGTYFFLKSSTSIDVSEFSLVPVLALISFVIIFAVGMQTIPMLILGEIFPANVKAFALCLADIYFSLAATLVSKVFQILKDSLGMYVPFYVFSISSLIGLVAIAIIVPETKGKTLEDIQKDFGGGINEDQDDNSTATEGA